MTEWPESFPAACPPDDAVSAEGQFFRLVDGEPPSANDFRSYAELVAAGVVRPRDGVDDCEAVGVSIFADRSDLERIRQAFGALRAKRVAMGSVDGSGVIKPTPRPKGPSHHTWWRPTEDAAWRTFQVA